MKQTNFINPSDSDQHHEQYSLFVDGASRGNPGPASVGMFCKSGDKVIFEHGFAIGVQTNNFAEYSALICGLFLVKQKTEGQKVKLEIFSDSQLLVFQLNGLYKVKHPAIKVLMEKAQKLVGSFDWKATHLLRDKNKIADKLANKGLDDNVPLPEELQKIIG